MPEFTSRRSFLLRSAGLMACSAAAHPLLSRVTFAAAPGDARLVVLILRGGMDGLDVVRPVFDPDFARLRPGLVGQQMGPALSQGFRLHPALGTLMPLWQAGELGFAHAVSTPYRDKRSHFDGQDLLEAGTGLDLAPGAQRDGWLNRLLQGLPGVESRTAFALGRGDLKLLNGPAPFTDWSPDAALHLSPQDRALFEHVYADDPVFAAASAEALALAELAATDAEAAGMDGDAMAGGAMAGGAMAGMSGAGPTGRRGAHAARALAEFAAQRLRAETRIAAFSLPGWDTHRGQSRGIVAPLERLAEVILTLRRDLGPVWGRTAVLAMTEFGRTAAENGSGGTDHGTGGAMLMAGGALRGGRIYGDWPGLSEAALYDRRDLMPTGDVRAYAAWAMRGLYGLDRRTLEELVFPGLDMAGDPGIVA